MPERPPRSAAAGTDADRRPRYRSLRDLSQGSRPSQRSQSSQSPGTAAGEPPAATAQAEPTASSIGRHRTGSRLKATTTPPPHEDASTWLPQNHERRSPLRYAVIGAVATLLLVGLTWGGYAGYRDFAPYYGVGYTTGGTAAVKAVWFKVTAARCGLDSSPVTSGEPTKGQFCVIDVLADNRAGRTRYLSLSLFSVRLDTGSEANPTGSAMRVLSTQLGADESRRLQLVYDVWDGVRMQELKVQIGYETATVPLL